MTQEPEKKKEKKYKQDPGPTQRGSDLSSTWLCCGRRSIDRAKQFAAFETSVAELATAQAPFWPEPCHAKAKSRFCMVLLQTKIVLGSFFNPGFRLVIMGLDFFDHSRRAAT